MSKTSDMDRYFEGLMYQARSPQEAMEIMKEYQQLLDRYSNSLYGYVNRPMGGPMLMPSIQSLGEPISTNTTPLPEEHLVSAVTAFRAWNVPLFCDELRSVAKPSKWLPYQRFEATCAAQQCAGVSCSCGIYAFNKMELVKTEYRGEGRSRKYVYGEVSLWGRVLECKDGYRAQFGYPKAFVNTGAIAKRMSEVFGVPLIGEKL